MCGIQKDLDRASGPKYFEIVWTNEKNGREDSPKD